MLCGKSDLSYVMEYTHVIYGLECLLVMQRQVGLNVDNFSNVAPAVLCYGRSHNANIQQSMLLTFLLQHQLTLFEFFRVCTCRYTDVL
jgi:hypothetical protein